MNNAKRLALLLLALVPAVAQAQTPIWTKMNVGIARNVSPVKIGVDVGTGTPSFISIGTVTGGIFTPTGGGGGGGGGTPGGSDGQLQINSSGSFAGATTGSGVLTALGFAVGTPGAFVVNGGAGGTPSSLTLTNASGLPTSGIANGALPSGVTVNNSNWSGTVLSVANGGTGTTTPSLVAGANVSITGTWPNQTVTSSGGGGGGGAGGYYAQAITPTGTNTFPSLSQSYTTGVGSAVMMVNGVGYTDHDATPCFSVTASVITWSAANCGFSVTTSDKVSIFYTQSAGGGVNSGTSGQLTYYSSSGATVSGTTTGTGVVTAVGNNTNSASGLPTINGAITVGNCLKWSASGIQDAGGACGSGGGAFPQTVSGTVTSGGIPYFASTTSMATSGVLAANAPVIGGGAGVAPSTGTRSGNTTTFATASGTLTNGHCVQFDASGNIVDAGGACTTGGGGGTVTSGTANQLAYYSSTGTTVAGLLAGTSAQMLVINGSSVPTFVTMSGDCTIANTGAITCTKVNGQTVSLAGSFTMSGAYAFTGTLTGATSVTFPTSGTLATTANINTALPSATSSQVYIGTGGAGVAAAGSVPAAALPAATSSTFGGVKVDGTTIANSAGSISLGLSNANTWTGTQTFSGTTSTIAAVLGNAAEPATISATAATGTINFYINSQSVLYYTTNASANWTVNFAMSAGTSLNTAMTTGQAITAVFMVTQGASPFYNSAVTIDGSAVTPKWQGGSAPSAGNASGIDVYTYTIIKTANATFTVLASQTQFK